MVMTYPPADKITAYYLKRMIDNKNTWPSHFDESKDVYGVDPWSLLVYGNHRRPSNLREGRYFFVKRTEDSGKTDGCGSGCWRVMGRDKLIKSEDKEKKKTEILGFKKVLKFCQKNRKRRSRFTTSDETWQRRIDEAHKRVWVMEEYRLASKWKQDYVICKIRRLDPKPLKLMLANHIRGYDI